MKIRIILFVSFFSIILFLSCSKSDEIFTPNRPNILFAIGDDISYPHMGAYGTDWVKTPAFDRVADQGLLFTNAYTPNAKCGPSRAIIITGRNSWQLEEAGNHFPRFPKKFKTVFEALKDAGYFVAYTAKGFAPGDVGTVNGKPREVTGKKYSDLTATPPTEYISNIDYAANFEKFLNDKDENTPFCFWYGSNEPHRAYEYGTGKNIGNKNIEEIDSVFKFWPDNEEVRNDILDYAFEIEHFDNHLGKMLKILEDRGELDNTIVIVTADNGMPFPRIKGQAYEYSNHLPLAIMWGDKISNPERVINEYVSFTDFAPTFLEAAGVTVEESGMQPLEGRSLYGIFRGEKNHRDFILIGKERHDIGRPDDVGYPIRGIVKGEYLYIRNFKTDRWPAGNPVTGYLNCDASPTKSAILDLRRSINSTAYREMKFGEKLEDEIFNIAQKYWDLSFGKRVSEELYNISKDPECINNLADIVVLNNVKSELNEILVSELTKQEDPRILGNGDVFDNYEYSSAQTRDFYNRFMKGELNKTSASWIDTTDFENSDL